MRLSSTIGYFLATLTAFLGSTGFWSWLQRRGVKKTATTRLLMGLAYDRITTVGMNYIDRGWISKDEYEEFRKYFYDPYVEFGGNGIAQKIMEEISKLPLRSNSEVHEVLQARSDQKGNND